MLRNTSSRRLLESFLFCVLVAGWLAVMASGSSWAEPLYGIGTSPFQTNLLIFDAAANTYVHTTEGLFLLAGGTENRAASPDGESLFLAQSPLDMLLRHSISKEKRKGTRKVEFSRWLDVTGDGRRVFISAVPFHNALFVFQTRPFRKIAEVTLGGSVFNVKVLPDGSKTFVLWKDDPPANPPAVKVVDGTSYTVTNTVDLVADTVASIQGATFSVDASRLYVGINSTDLGRVIVVFNTATETVEDTIVIDPCFPDDLAATTNRIWVDCGAGELLAVNATTGDVDGQLLFGRPIGSVVASDTLNKVFISLSASPTALGVINATDIAVETEIPTPEFPGFLALGPKTALRKAKIKPATGRLRSKSLFDPPVDSVIDPPTQTVSVTVSDPDGPAWTATVPPGNFEAAGGGRFKFGDGSGTIANGLQRVLISPPRSPASLYFSADIKAASPDLSAIDKLDVTLTLTIGSDTFTVTRPFIDKAGTFRFP